MIPEIELKTYSIDFFDRKIYFYAYSSDLDFINLFVENLKNGISFDDSIKLITFDKNISSTNYITNRFNCFFILKKEIHKLQRLQKIKILKNES